MLGVDPWTAFVVIAMLITSLLLITTLLLFFAYRSRYSARPPYKHLYDPTSIQNWDNERHD